MKLQLNNAESAFLRRHGLESDDEDPATAPTTASMDFKFAQPSEKEATKKRRTVHFNEEDNQEHVNTVLSRDECKELWYSMADLTAFRLQARMLARDLYTLEKIHADKPHSFGKSYSVVYQQCCQAKNDKDVAFDAASAHDNLDIFSLGMERRGIPAIAREVVDRRNHLTDEVLYWQACPMVSSAELRQRMMVEMSSQRSRPSRLFAHFTALVSAATEL